MDQDCTRLAESLLAEPAARDGGRLARIESAAGRGFRRAGRFLRRTSRSARASIALTALVSLAISVGLSLLVRFPRPFVHDEFSYLLAADTFAHGRLTNPTHPLWIHFESFHIIQRPSYASKYPPAQGLVLALGQAVAGWPIAGAWLATALACAATCWMLRAWTRPRWALVGALIVAFHPVVIGWGQTYWGGSVAMLGGALVLGALPRLVSSKRPELHDALLMGLGMAILANSRPFEGMVVSALASLVLVAGLLGRSGPPWRVSLLRVAIPIGLVLAVMAGAMGFYNARVTGKPLRMPYMVYETTYSRTPVLFGQPLRAAPSYNHDVMRHHHDDWEMGFFLGERRLGEIFGIGLEKVWYLLTSFLPGTAMAVGLLVVVFTPWLLRSHRRSAPALVICGVFFAAMMLETARPQSHYAAPIVCLGLVPILDALRRLGTWKRDGKPTGRLLVRVLAVSWMALVFKVALAQATLGDADPDSKQIAERARILSRLEHEPGHHLVVVRYAPDHSTHAEWVYNGADLDGAKVLWAREMDPPHNQQLLAYFRDRRVWLVEPDRAPSQLLPYHPAETAASSDPGRR